MSKIQQNKEADIYKILIYCVFHLINGNVKWNATCTSKFSLIDICGFIWNVILFMVWKKKTKNHFKLFWMPIHVFIFVTYCTILN